MMYHIYISINSFLNDKSKLPFDFFKGWTEAWLVLPARLNNFPNFFKGLFGEE